jgi:tryptophanyl-tRNA synthetase
MDEKAEVRVPDSTQPLQPRRRVLSGVQPTGTIHLGNYFGAIRNHVELQDTAECFFLIADLHALTSTRNPETLRMRSLELAATYLACGLDPERAALYRQSDVPEATEVAWLLGSVTPFHLLDKAVSFKEAKARSEQIDSGLFWYPVLMSADILQIRAQVVPVGRDQIQHLEIARDIAKRFNRIYGAGREPLILPEALLSATPFVPGIDGEKMSKRHDNTIGIFDNPAMIREKAARIKTDSRDRFDPKDPDTCTVFALAAMVSTEPEVAELRRKYVTGTIGYDSAKTLLAERLVSYFGPIRDKYEGLLKEPEKIETVLERGAIAVRDAVRPVLAELRALVGVSAARCELRS